MIEQDRGSRAAGKSERRRPAPVLPAGLRAPAALGAASCAMGMVALGIAYAGDSVPGRFDRWAFALVSARIPGPTGIWELPEIIGDPVPATVAVMLLAVIGARLGGLPLAATVALGILFTGVVTTVLKPIVGRTIHGSLCFPSGHTAAFTAMGMSVGFMLVRRLTLGGPVALLTMLGSGVTTGTVAGLELITDDIHYPTDTVGGLLVALAVMPAVALLVDQFVESRTRSVEVSEGRRACSASEYPSALLAVAGYGLPGERPRFPAEPLDHPGWEELVAAAEHNRMTGLLLATIRSGALPATPEQARSAKAIHRLKLLRMMALEQELIGIVDRLGRAGVDSRILKGSAFANLDYPDPALRSFIDMDLLVRAEDIDRVVALLADAGYHRTVPEPRPGFDRRFEKGMTIMTPSGFELDLHRTLVLGPWGLRVDLDRLWDEGEEFHLCGRPVRALSRPNRFMHACYHAALGNWPLRLGSLRDVAEILHRLDPQEADSVLQLVESWGVEAVVASAIEDAHRLLGIFPDTKLALWAQNYRPSRKDVSWLALYTREDRMFAAQKLATLGELPWRDKVGYAHALIFADPAYTAGRHSSAAARFGNATREFRLARRGRGDPHGQ